MTTPELLTALRSAQAGLTAAPVAGWDAATDAELSELILLSASLRQTIERHVALGAGEVARRSTVEHGFTGFAQRAGHRTVEEFLRVETGVTGRDAATSVRVGALAGAGGVLGEALVGGRVSVAAADAIHAGLGSPSDGVPVELLEQATERLCDEAETLDPDRLQRRAREVRDELDDAGVADRETQRRAARSLRLVRQADGMTRIIWLLDPESAAIVTQIYDRATSPRRGGPTFVDTAQVARAASLRDDSRSTEQIASDAFTELLRESAILDDSVLLGGDEPAVRILVTADALATRSGHGVLESGETVSMTSVERLVCAGSSQPVILNGTGQVLDFGRTQRLFTRRQRQALAVRDGGCMWLGCDRPPSWTEAHHVEEWLRDRGRTDLANGILLCRHHHLRLHDEGWRIQRRDGRYWLQRPPVRGGSEVLLETKSRAVRELRAAG